MFGGVSLNIPGDTRGAGMMVTAAAATTAADEPPITPGVGIMRAESGPAAMLEGLTLNTPAPSTTGVGLEAKEGDGATVVVQRGAGNQNQGVLFCHRALIRSVTDCAIRVFTDGAIAWRDGYVWGLDMFAGGVQGVEDADGGLISDRANNILRSRHLRCRLRR